MSRRRSKKLAPVWGLMAGTALFWVVIGTTYTNIVALANRFPFPLYLGMAFAITMGFTLPMFMDYMNIGVRLTITLVMVISSSLAINAMTGKEIIGLEQRLKSDTEYNDLIKIAKDLDEDYDRANDQLTEYIRLQTESKWSWNDGAKATRISRDTLFSQKTRAWQSVAVRKNFLKDKGTVTQEAFIETFSAVMPFIPVRSISVGSNIIFSIINDTLIPIFAAILVSLYPALLIPIRRNKKKKGQNRFGRWFGRWSERVRRLFDKSSEKFGTEAEILSASSFRGREVVRRTNQIRDAYPDLTLDQIGAIVGKLVRDKPYKKNYISEILNEKYGRG